ncbi:MAG: hypothetical protein HRT44_02435 [Bdellovibrionales bacterium]|nr:hypothetical protein [Bdellovibrionales bacterium]NQZ18105.1 hypothetical protein [Bdellovibrionales bacterium]
MNKVISLFSYNNKKESYPFLVFDCEDLSKLEFISPDIMKLNDSVFVADLSIVKSYWEKSAAKSGLDLTDYLEKEILNKELKSQILIFCDHPFQGFLFYNHLEQLGARGVFRSNSLFSEKTYSNMSWHTWFLTARYIDDRFEQSNTLKKERRSFKSKLRQFEIFTERLDLKNFYDLKEAHFYEIKRRFSGFIGDLWCWSFPDHTEEEVEANLFNYQNYQLLQSFPWLPFRARENPFINRFLEYPKSTWDQVKEDIEECIDKLTKHERLRKPIKVLEIQWSVTLFDLTEVILFINLKYPLALNSENSQAILKQFQFAFERIEKEVQAKDEELEIVNTQLLLGWSIEVTKTVITRQKNTDFFESEINAEIAIVEDLKNKVSSDIESYEIEEHFTPGLDFKESTIEGSAKKSSFIDMLSLFRPFYFFPSQEKILDKDIKAKRFIDRTSSDWWNSGDLKDSFRDCYICELNSGEQIFAYRNYKNEWFKYGF